MTEFPTYHDLVAANIPPDVVAAIEESYGLPILEAVEKYCSPAILCDGDSYVAIATPPGAGREHFAAVEEAYRAVGAMGAVRVGAAAAFPKAAPRLDAAPVKPSPEPLPSPPPDGLLTPVETARKLRKPRRPSISKMIEQAEKAGTPLASITLADGTKLDFGKPESVEPDNPWPLDEFRTKETKQ